MSEQSTVFHLQQKRTNALLLKPGIHRTKQKNNAIVHHTNNNTAILEDEWTYQTTFYISYQNCSSRTANEWSVNKVF